MRVRRVRIGAGILNSNFEKKNQSCRQYIGRRRRIQRDTSSVLLSDLGRKDPYIVGVGESVYLIFRVFLLLNDFSLFYRAFQCPLSITKSK